MSAKLEAEMPAPERMSKRDLEALGRFRYELLRFQRASERLARSRGLTVLQYLVLLQCQAFPGRNWATTEELAERLLLQHHAAVAVVARCRSAGLVVLRHVPGQRAAEVHLTRHGEECLEALARLHREQLGTLREAVGQLPT